MRTASMPQERWARKATECCTGFQHKKTRTYRAVGRPRKRWEDEVNDILRPGETGETRGNDTRNNDTWIKIAKDQKSWKQMESEFAMAAAALPGAQRHRGNRAVQHDDPHFRKAGWWGQVGP